MSFRSVLVFYILWICLSSTSVYAVQTNDCLSYDSINSTQSFDKEKCKAKLIPEVQFYSSLKMNKRDATRSALMPLIDLSRKKAEIEGIIAVNNNSNLDITNDRKRKIEKLESDNNELLKIIGSICNDTTISNEEYALRRCEENNTFARGHTCGLHGNGSCTDWLQDCSPHVIALNEKKKKIQPCGGHIRTLNGNLYQLEILNESVRANQGLKSNTYLKSLLKSYNDMEVWSQDELAAIPEPVVCFPENECLSSCHEGYRCDYFPDSDNYKIVDAEDGYRFLPNSYAISKCSIHEVCKNGKVVSCKLKGRAVKADENRCSGLLDNYKESVYPADYRVSPIGCEPDEGCVGGKVTCKDVRYKYNEKELDCNAISDGYKLVVTEHYPEGQVIKCADGYETCINDIVTCDVEGMTVNELRSCNNYLPGYKRLVSGGIVRCTDGQEECANGVVYCLKRGRKYSRSTGACTDFTLGYKPSDPANKEDPTLDATACTLNDTAPECPILSSGSTGKLSFTPAMCSSGAQGESHNGVNIVGSPEKIINISSISYEKPIAKYTTIGNVTSVNLIQQGDLFTLDTATSSIFLNETMTINELKIKLINASGSMYPITLEASLDSGIDKKEIEINFLDDVNAQMSLEITSTTNASGQVLLSGLSSANSIAKITTNNRPNGQQTLYTLDGNPLFNIDAITGSISLKSKSKNTMLQIEANLSQQFNVSAESTTNSTNKAKKSFSIGFNDDVDPSLKVTMVDDGIVKISKLTGKLKVAEIMDFDESINTYKLSSDVRSLNQHLMLEGGSVYLYSSDFNLLTKKISSLEESFITLIAEDANKNTTTFKGKMIFVDDVKPIVNVNGQMVLLIDMVLPEVVVAEFSSQNKNTVNYELFSTSSVASLFYIDSNKLKTRNINDTTKKELLAEKEIKFIVKATDNHGNFSITELLLKIQDNVPPKLSVFPTGYIKLSPKYIDRDIATISASNEVEPVSYNISNQNPGDYFEIKSTGKLLLKNKTDEAIEKLKYAKKAKITITATDTSNNVSDKDIEVNIVEGLEPELVLGNNKIDIKVSDLKNKKNISLTSVSSEQGVTLEIYPINQKLLSINSQNIIVLGNYDNIDDLLSNSPMSYTIKATDSNGFNTERNLSLNIIDDEPPSLTTVYPNGEIVTLSQALQGKILAAIVSNRANKVASFVLLNKKPGDEIFSINTNGEIILFEHKVEVLKKLLDIKKTLEVKVTDFNGNIIYKNIDIQLNHQEFPVFSKANYNFNDLNLVDGENNLGQTPASDPLKLGLRYILQNSEFSKYFEINNAGIIVLSADGILNKKLLIKQRTVSLIAEVFDAFQGKSSVDILLSFLSANVCRDYESVICEDGIVINAGPGYVPTEDGLSIEKCNGNVVCDGISKQKCLVGASCKDGVIIDAGDGYQITNFDSSVGGGTEREKCLSASCSGRSIDIGNLDPAGKAIVNQVCRNGLTNCNIYSNVKTSTAGSCSAGQAVVIDLQYTTNATQLPGQIINRTQSDKNGYVVAQIELLGEKCRINQLINDKIFQSELIDLIKPFTSKKLAGELDYQFISGSMYIIATGIDIDDLKIELRNKAESQRLSLQGSLSAFIDHGNCLINWQEQWQAEASANLGGYYNKSNDIDSRTLKSGLQISTGYHRYCFSFNSSITYDVSERDDIINTRLETFHKKGAGSVKVGLIKGNIDDGTAFITKNYTVYSYLSYAQGQSISKEKDASLVNRTEANAWQIAGGVGIQAQGNLCGRYDLNIGYYSGKSDSESESNSIVVPDSGDTNGATYSASVNCPLAKIPLYWNAKYRYDTDDDESITNYGLGLGYNITENMRFEVNWERTHVNTVLDRSLTANFVYDFLRMR